MNCYSVTTWNPTAEAGAGIADMEPNGWVRRYPGYRKLTSCHSLRFHDPSGQVRLYRAWICQELEDPCAGRGMDWSAGIEDCRRGLNRRKRKVVNNGKPVISSGRKGKARST